MNQNVNEAESFAGDYVASEEGRLFFEVPLSLTAVQADPIHSDRNYRKRSVICLFTLLETASPSWRI
jgi:hypothetical protein